MIWLQSNDKYDELAEYHHDKGTFTMASRSHLGDKAPSGTDGTFAILSTVFVAVYKFGQELFIRIGNKCIPLTDDIAVMVSGPKTNRLLRIEKVGEKIACFNYQVDDSKIFSDDLTPFVEDEDFDYGLFLSNISKDKGHQRVLLQQFPLK